MVLKSCITPNIFLHVPKNYLSSDAKDLRLAFFITGNPGLIGYYHSFLSLLSHSEEGKDRIIFGASLGGFEVHGRFKSNSNGGDSDGGGDAGWSEDESLSGEVGGLLHRRTIGDLCGGDGRRGMVWGLRQQVDLCLLRLRALVGMIRADIIEEESGNAVGSAGSDEKQGKRKVEVVLMGHSVGAWIAMEMLRVVNSRKELRLKHGLQAEDGLGKEEWDIEAAMLLTPTIMELALSKNGRVAGPLLGWLPYLPELAQWSLYGLRWGLGEKWLRWAVANFMGLSEEEQGVKTTVKFLMSDWGVKQSLALARDELEIIAEDEWGDEIWAEKVKEAVDSREEEKLQKPPNLYFLFAEKDHWVADRTRKKIVEKTEGGDRCVVDGSGLQHAWCLRQNVEVAEYVKGWLKDIRETAR